MLLLLLVLLAVVFGVAALACVGAADSVEGREREPRVVWPIIIAGTIVLLICVAIVAALGVSIALGGRMTDDDEGAVVASIVAVLLFGPIGVLLVLLGLSLRQRTFELSGRGRWLRILTMAYGYFLCCVTPAVVFPPFAGLTIAAVFSGFAYVRRTRHAKLLWMLTIAVERGFPLGPELAATGAALGGSSGAKLLRLAEDVDDGVPLSEALQRRSGLVPTTAVLDARVGEQTGRLAESLRAAALHTSGAIRQTTQAGYAAGVITYFWAVLLTLCGIVSFLMYYIIPKFKAIFEDFDVQLPPASIALIEVSDFSVDWWFLLLPVLLAFVMLSLFVGECYRRGGQNLSLPWFTRWFPRLDTAGILRNLSRAVETRTPLAPVVETLSRHHHRPHIAASLASVRDGIERGGNAWLGLERSGLLRPAEVDLLQAAEAAGNLPWALHDVADRIERRRAERFAWWFEILRPWPLIILALLAAFVAVGMFSPLMTLLGELAQETV